MYARGNNRGAIYRDDGDRRLYLENLRMTVARAEWRCLAYCLMDNHVHLVIQTPKANLGRGMQRLHGLYGRQFNIRHGRSGHVFQGRYGSERITDDRQLFAVARYVARNPVEAGLCSRAAEWPWSSHADVLTGTSPPWLDSEALLAYFGSGGGDPLANYRLMVDDEPRQVVRELFRSPRGHRRAPEGESRAA